MKHSKHFVLVLVSAICSVTLSACGGGTSGGSTSFVGTYGGFGILTATTLGRSETETVAIEVAVNADGTVVLDPGSGMEGAGMISANKITASYPASLANEPGFVCTGTHYVSATGSGTSFTGTFGPNTIICNGVPTTSEGTFTVTKYANLILHE